MITKFILINVGGSFVKLEERCWKASAKSDREVEDAKSELLKTKDQLEEKIRSDWDNLFHVIFYILYQIEYCSNKNRRERMFGVEREFFIQAKTR